MERPPARSPWLTPLAWSLLSLLALLVFELTAEPAISSAVLCSKFGWNDAQTGIWLWRNDSKAGRGAACLWFSLMIAVCRISFATVALMVAMFAGLIVIAHFAPGGAGGFPAPAGFFATQFCVLAVTEILMVLFALPGCVIAHWHNLQVWISPALHRSRCRGEWPPGRDYAADRINLADAVLLFSVAIGVSFIAGVAILLIMELQLPAVPVVALTVVAAAAFVRLSRGVTATHFAACWPHAEWADLIGR